MIQVLYANATILSTPLTGGEDGNVGLIMKDNLYYTLKMGTQWEDKDDPSAIPTTAKHATVAHCQQANEKYGEAHRIFENAATMDKSLKQQIIETIEETYIAELWNKYTGFMGVKTIDLVHHIMNRYGKW